MTKVGIVGLGNMGMGMAKNLIKNGFETRGSDLVQDKLDEFEGYGGIPCKTAAEVAADSEVIFIMVLNARQSNAVCFGKNGLADTIKPGTVVYLTASIGMENAKVLAAKLAEINVEFIDSAVTGGPGGAHSGNLTLMAAGKREIFDKCKPVMDAVSNNPVYCGDQPGQGQLVKSCLQCLIGAEFQATFELLTLGAKAGVDPKVIYDVISNSGGGCGPFKLAVPNIMERKFTDGGAGIDTLHKDLNITLNLAKEVGAYMPATAAITQMFDAAITKYPTEDIWSITKILENIAGTEVKHIEK